jgi:hypothetical protein
MLENHVEYESDTSSTKFTAFFARFLPASLLVVSDLFYESGMIRTQMRNSK